MVAKKILVLRYKPIRNEHQPRMGGRIFLPVVVKIVAMPLQVLFIQSSTLDFDQQVTIKPIPEEDIRTSAINENLAANQSQTGFDEQVGAVRNRFFHLDFEHSRTLERAGKRVNIKHIRLVALIDGLGGRCLHSTP